MRTERIWWTGTAFYDYDVTKLSVYTQGIGLTGIEVYDILETNMISRSNLGISATSWHIFPSETVSRILSAW